MCVWETDRQRQRETERELENFNTSRIIALGPNSQSLLYYKHRLAQLYYKHIIMNTNKQYINEREREGLNDPGRQKLECTLSQNPYKAIFLPAPSSESRPLIASWFRN